MKAKKVKLTEFLDNTTENPYLKDLEDKFFEQHSAEFHTIMEISKYYKKSYEQCTDEEILEWKRRNEP